MPNENENGVKSFSIHETEEMIQFFDQYGFVVVDNILDSQECDRSMDEVWDYIEQRARCTGKAINRDNPNTWVDSNWPKEICKNGGFIGKFPYWKRMASLNDTLVNVQPQAWKNRENPKVYKVFSQLMRQPNLWVSIDRYGIMRPSKRSNIEPTVKWQTKSNWLHWVSIAKFKLHTRMSNEPCNRIYLHFITERLLLDTHLISVKQNSN